MKLRQSKHECVCVCTGVYLCVCLPLFLTMTPHPPHYDVLNGYQVRIWLVKDTAAVDVWFGYKNGTERPRSCAEMIAAGKHMHTQQGSSGRECVAVWNQKAD